MGPLAAFLHKPIIVPFIAGRVPVNGETEERNGNGTYITPAWLIRWSLPTVAMFLLGQWLLINATVKSSIADAGREITISMETRYLSTKEYEARRLDTERRIQNLEAVDRDAAGQRSANESRIRQLELDMEKIKTKNGYR